MGLFRKSDELFEIMARQKGQRVGSAAGAGTQSTSQARPRASSGAWDTPRSASSSASWDAPRPAASSSWRAPRLKPGGSNSDLYELDGDALVLLEDALEEPAPATGADEAVKTYSVRADTAVVGGILFAALLGAAFLMGRNVGGDAPAVSEPTVIRVAAAETPTASAEPEQPAPGPSSVQPVPASLPPNTQTSVPASFRTSEDATAATSAPAAARRAEGTTVAAGSPISAAPRRQAAEGKYVLIVCSTTAENGQKVATWLNENAASALANQLSLEAYSTSRGSVRIKGFQERDAEVLARIQATVDPLGGSETFHSAYYQTQR